MGHEAHLLLRVIAMVLSMDKPEETHKTKWWTYHTVIRTRNRPRHYNV